MSLKEYLVDQGYDEELVTSILDDPVNALVQNDEDEEDDDDEEANDNEEDSQGDEMFGLADDLPPLLLGDEHGPVDAVNVQPVQMAQMAPLVVDIPTGWMAVEPARMNVGDKAVQMAQV